MLTRKRKAWGIAASAVALAVIGGAFSRSPALRASFTAAYRAFRDPTLLDPPAPLPAPAPVSCARFEGEGQGRRVDVDLDADLSRAFQRPPAPIDLADPDSATLSTLTLPDVHVPITRRALRYVRFFTQTEAGRTAFLQRYRRAGLYRESVAYALREAGLPEDLMWLAAVESGFDPRAVSPVGAAGLWQFMPETGQLYGLDQSVWVDERRSIVRATHAAVTHLRDLHERFGRWDLALAAYNAGYDRVASAVEKVAQSRGPERLSDKPIGFADVAAARALPEETINYVPQIVAFALVAANRTRFGLDMPELVTPLEVGEIAVPAGTRLRTIARAAGISVNVLRDYNPQLLRDRTPPIGGDYLVALPESRVQRALASFPVYADQEVVAQNDEAPDLESPVPSSLAGLGVDLEDFGKSPDAEDPLPRRPVALGKNRLPEITMPGRERVLVTAGALGVSLLQAKLPKELAVPEIGWRRGYVDDPLGVLGGRDGRPGAVAAKAGETALQKQLGFLNEMPGAVETLRTFTLPSGITVRVRRDKGAPATAITVRVATVEEEGAFPRIRRGAEAGSAEALHTITVDSADADAGVELAATRLRLALGDTSAAQLAEIRFRAGDPRRKLLQKTPYGPSWIALGEALFPPDHPLAGTVLGTGSDGGALREMMVAEAMRREHALARASITVVGDIDELRVKKLAESFLASVSAPSTAAIAPHPRDERLTVEDNVPGPRLLVGWIGPGEGEVGDASLRVAIECLENAKVGLLGKLLGDVASTAHADLEIWPRASVATIELAPAHDVETALHRLESELAKLADDGLDFNSVAMAKWLLHARLQKEKAAAHATGIAGAVHSAGLVKLRHALRPWAGERAEKALDEVTVSSVRAAVRRVLSSEHRVVVTTRPKG
ncbi:Membrane-bound lytic murein transglycosylase D precursor [Minicystis rosea]|nr:Membrane-bound lytic murein transglycosylase D precursor [Minicystis rosea]